MDADPFRSGRHSQTTATRERAAEGSIWPAPRRYEGENRGETPNLRRKTFLRLLDPRRRHDWALLSVVRESYRTGAATRRVNGLAEALGVSREDDDEVRLAARDLDRRAEEFRRRPLTMALPYIVIDVVTQKVRDRGHVIDQSIAVVVGVDTDGNRRVIGYEAGSPADPEFWLSLLVGLRDRGAFGVRLVTADSFNGLDQAIRRIFPGATWQRSRTGYVEAALQAAAPEQRMQLTRALREAFEQPERALTLAALQSVVAEFAEGNAPLRSQLTADREALLAYHEVPREHRMRVQSTTCLAPSRRNLLRHCRTVGIFPNPQSLLRLVGVLLEEQHDEWAAGPRYIGFPARDPLSEADEVRGRLVLLRPA